MAVEINSGVPAFFLACVGSVAVSSPQADTCGFNPYVCVCDPFTLSASISPPITSLVSLHPPHQPCLCSHSCFFDSSLPFFHNTYFLFIFLISLANIFSTLFHLFDEVLSSFFPSLSLLDTSAIAVLVIYSALKPLKYFPTGALQLHHGRMYYLPLTSHYFESCQKHLSSPEMCDCVFEWLELYPEPQGVREIYCMFYNCPGTSEVQIWSRYFL